MIYKYLFLGSCDYYKISKRLTKSEVIKNYL